MERRKVRTFSGGQKRRLDLALGLIGDPELLFLDEPTTGFDAAARQDAWQTIRKLRADGTTILLTTHDLAEAQALADRLVLLAGGVVVAAGPPAAIGDRDTGVTRIVFTAFAASTGLTTADLPLPAADQDGTVVVETTSPVLTLHQLTGWALERGVELARLTVERPSLEDAYLRLTGGLDDRHH